MRKAIAARHSMSKLGVATAALMFACIAAAHDFGGVTTPEEEDPPKECPPCDSELPSQCPPCGRSEGPISYWNGGESITTTDLVVRGVFPITIRRKYDSHSEFDSPLGFGWVFLHERRLYEYPDGSVLLRYGAAARDRFVYSGGAYVTPAGGVLASLVESVSGTFTLTYANGQLDEFDSQGRLTAVQDRHGNRHEYSYDSRGKLPLVGTSNAAVNPTTPMVVAQNYRLVRIDERAPNGVLTGRYVTFQYSETTGRVTTVAANDGRTVTYEHDVTATLTKGNLVEVNGLEGIVTTYDYADANDLHNLTSIVPATGRTAIVNTYDDQDRVIQQVEGTRKIQFNYQIPFSRTVVTKTIKDHNGLNPYTAIFTFDFDASGRITKETDALGHESRYVYNSSNALTRKERWQNIGGTLSLLQAVDYTYDVVGHKLTESVALDGGEVVTRTWTYDHDRVASDQVVSSVAPTKLFRTEYTFFYDANGRPTGIASEKRRKDDETFQTTSYTYDARNRLLTTTLPDGVKVVRTYTGNYVSKIAYETGGTEIGTMKRRFEFDSEGNLSKEWDARDNLTQFAYDDWGRLVSKTNPLGQQSLYTYTDELLTQVEFGRTTVDGEGQLNKLIYDTRGRLTAVQRKDESASFQTFKSFALDSEGRRLAVTDALNRITYIAYDLLGRPIQTSDPLSLVTSFAYDAAGNRISVTDASGRVVSYEYDDLNRQTAVLQVGVSPNARTEFTHDAAGNLTSVKDGENRTTNYVYDTLSRQLSITQPLGQQVQYSYDNRDRVDSLVNARGNKIDYAYEDWGQFKEEKHYATTSSGTPTRVLNYAHDLDGNVTTVTDDAIQATPTYVLTYDELGRLYDETAKYLPGGDRVLNHRYDRYGNRNSLTLNDGSALVHSYAFDKRNRLTAATLVGASVDVGYFANDGRQTVTLPGNVTRSYTYKANGPIDTITVTGSGGQLAQFAYVYDNVLNVDTLTTPDGVHDYGYDGLNRLTSAVHPSGLGLSDESYTYDRVGNREDTSNPSFYAYDGNHRITNSPTSLTYTFDADGSVATRSDGATFAHDYRSRLTQFVKGATTASYLHDAFGRRIKKTINGAVIWYLWDGKRLLAEFNDSGIRTQRYAYLGSDYTPTQVQDANGTFYVHTDSLDTPRIATSGSGVTIWKARLEAFGTTVVDPDPDGNGQLVTLNMRFPGQYADAESGIYYNYFRDYDPTIGRYLQADPIGLRGGVNLYAYASASPTHFIDPYGLDVFRGPDNYFSDIPPPGPDCWRAVIGRGGYINDWKKCDFDPSGDEGYCPTPDQSIDDWRDKTGARDSGAGSEPGQAAPDDLNLDSGGPGSTRAERDQEFTNCLQHRLVRNSLHFIVGELLVYDILLGFHIAGAITAGTAFAIGLPAAAFGAVVGGAYLLLDAYQHCSPSGFR